MAGREPAIEGVTIYANSGRYDNLALVRLFQVPLQDRHQLIWARHLDAGVERKFMRSTFGLFAFDFCSIASTSALFSISMTPDKFVLLDQRLCCVVCFFRSIAPLSLLLVHDHLQRLY